MPPKVLFVGSTTQVHSGANQWMVRLAAGLRDRGYETLALLPAREGIADRYEAAGVPVLTAWAEPIRRFESALGYLRFLLCACVAIPRLAWLVRRRDVDVVHVNELRYVYALVGARLGGARTVCHVRMIRERDPVTRAMTGLARRLAHRVVCVSAATSERMFGPGARDVTVLHDGLPDPERFADLGDGAAFRRPYDVDPDAVLVVAVSKLTRNKGQDRLLAAAEGLEGSDPAVEVAVVGGSVAGHEDYAADLERRAADLETVRLTGFHEDVAEAYAAADVVVHVPRHHDPFPGVVLEAMAAGRPVIASRSGGIPEQLDHGETGLLVPRTDGVDDISAAIADLAGDAGKRRRLGDRAETVARERFDPDRYLDDVAALYADLGVPGETA